MYKKVTNSDIQRVKNQIPLVSLLAARGIDLAKKGENYTGLCPFHTEKTPSFVVTPSKNLWHCFGTCNKGGSNIDFVMQYESLNFIKATNYLLENYNLKSEPIKPIQVSQERKSMEEFNIQSAEVQKALRKVVDHYQSLLKQRPEPVDYLMKRGITQGELIEEFQIGFCDGNLLSRVSEPEQVEILKSAGLIKGKYEHFRNCIVFPIIDENGLITEIYGRSIDASNNIKHIYLPGEHKGIFNPKALITKEVFVCESIIDAISLMTLGFKNVTSTYGINGFTDEMLVNFEAEEIEKATFVFDNDSAGKSATVKITERLKEKSIVCHRVNLPVKDVNAFIRKSENPDQEFRELLEARETLWQVEEEKSSLLVAESESTESTEKENWQKVNDEYHFTFGNRSYIIRGVEEIKSNTSLKVFIRLNYNNKFHIDNNLDLFNAKALGSFIRGVQSYLDIDERVSKDDTDKITVTLDDIVKKKLSAKKETVVNTDFNINLRTQQQAFALSKDKNLVSHFLHSVEKCGLIGENMNALICFLATLSRKLPNPLHIIIQAESSAGKSTVMNLVTSFVPPEDLLYFTQLTPQSLYYIEPGALKNKTLAIAELEGLSNIFYPLKQLMSENKLSNLSTGSDPKTGEHRSTLYENEGPTNVLFTSPKEGTDEEVQNRCLILSLNESMEQTKRIQQMQRLKHSYEGIKMIKEKETIIELFQHLQREIKPIPIFNPYAPYLSFTSENHQTRRHNEKYLILMDCLTLFFQNQREHILRNGVKMVKTHLIDVALTNFIAMRVFTKSLDELPPQTRNFLDKIEDYILAESKKDNINPENFWLYRRQMREITNLSPTRTHEHVNRLERFDYITSKRDQNGYAYRIIFFEQDGRARSLLSLTEVKTLKKKASQKEREEYESYLPYLEQIFESLDADYKISNEDVA